MSDLRRAEEQVLAAKRRTNCAFPRSNDGGEGREEFRRAVHDLIIGRQQLLEVESRQASDDAGRSDPRRR